MSIPTAMCFNSKICIQIWVMPEGLCKAWPALFLQVVEPRVKLPLCIARLKIQTMDSWDSLCVSGTFDQPHRAA